MIQRHFVLGYPQAQRELELVVELVADVTKGRDGFLFLIEDLEGQELEEVVQVVGVEFVLGIVEADDPLQGPVRRRRRAQLLRPGIRFVLIKVVRQHVRRPVVIAGQETLELVVGRNGRDGEALQFPLQVHRAADGFKVHLLVEIEITLSRVTTLLDTIRVNVTEEVDTVVAYRAIAGGHVAERHGINHADVLVVETVRVVL